MTRILVIKLGALGDFFYALGAMRAIRVHHPQARLSLLTSKPYADIARDSGIFDEVLIDARPKYDPRDWLRQRRFLNDLKIDRVYDLQNNTRTARYLRLMSPRPEWVGAAKGASHRNHDPDRTRFHAFRGLQANLALAGIAPVELDRLDWLKGDAAQFAPRRPYVLLVPGSAPTRPGKRWPVESYRIMSEGLIARGFEVLFLGSESEKDLVRQIAGGTTARDLSGRTSLGDVAALARGAAFAVGNDTGPLHIASMTGCPTLMFFASRESTIRKHGPQASSARGLEADDLSRISAENAFAELNAMGVLDAQVMRAAMSSQGA
jgi:ADP-heptose:LPS heptosyltransferase